MKILLLVLSSFLFLYAAQASGHHSAASFDLNATTTLQGEVLRFVWRNPHSYIYVEVENETGENHVWQLEADPTPLMSRSGWTPTSLMR